MWLSSLDDEDISQSQNDLYGTRLKTRGNMKPMSRKMQDQVNILQKGRLGHIPPGFQPRSCPCFGTVIFSVVCKIDKSVQEAAKVIDIVFVPTSYQYLLTIQCLP
jgi:hypothetical protein